MRRRVDGDTIYLESEDGSLLLTTQIEDGKATLTHGNWKMVKDMAANPIITLSSLMPLRVRSLFFRFFDVTLCLTSNLPDVLADFRTMYNNFIIDYSDEPSLSIFALGNEAQAQYPYTLIMVPGLSTRLKGDFTPVSYLYREEDLLFQVHSEAEVLLLTNNPNFSFIHGGSVTKGGHGYILPADSCSGKTTLTLALCKAGYTFYSDEFAVLDSIGRLHPFPRSMSLRDGTLKLFPEMDAARDSMTALKSEKDTLYAFDPYQTTPMPESRAENIQFIIFPTYTPDTRPAIRHIPPMEAFRRLVGSKNYLSLGTADKQSAVDLMLSVISKAKCFDLTTGDLATTVSLLDELEAL